MKHQIMWASRMMSLSVPECTNYFVRYRKARVVTANSVEIMVRLELRGPK